MGSAFRVGHAPKDGDDAVEQRGGRGDLGLGDVAPGRGEGQSGQG